MDTDWLLIGIVIAAFLYFSGYRSWGILIAILLFVIFSVSVIFSRSSKSKEPASGSNILEPIIIESTRGAPYRIPERLDIMYDPKAGMTKWWEKVGKRGYGKAAGRVLKKVRDSFD